MSSLNAVWGSSGTDVFAVGHNLFDFGLYYYTITHYDGNSWSLMSKEAATSGTTNNLHGIWGTSSSDVYAVGAAGTILHYDGNIWTDMASGTSSSLNDICGSSNTDIFAVGDKYYSSGWRHTILHYDGSSWSSVSIDTNPYIPGFLEAVLCRSSSEAVAVGSFGTILQYDGNNWAESESVTDNWLKAICDISNTESFVCGFGGTILQADIIPNSNDDDDDENNDDLISSSGSGCFINTINLFN